MVWGRGVACARGDEHVQKSEGSRDGRRDRSETGERKEGGGGSEWTTDG